MLIIQLFFFFSNQVTSWIHCETSSSRPKKNTQLLRMQSKMHLDRKIELFCFRLTAQITGMILKLHGFLRWLPHSSALSGFFHESNPIVMVGSAPSTMKIGPKGPKLFFSYY